MTSTTDKRKHRNKGFYKDFSKKNKCGILKPGMKGILLTCNGYEKQCVKEAYNLLNEYADNLYGPEFEVLDETKMELLQEDQLESELNILKAKKQDRRFQQRMTKSKNIIFIETTLSDTGHLVSAIFKDLIETGQKKTRYILKMLPILNTCKCSAEDFKKCLANIIDQKYPNSDTCPKLLYKVHCKVRNNSSVDSSDFIWYSRELIGSIRQTWVATLDNPDIIVEINIFQFICCMGILDCYEDFKKYNLVSIVPLHSEATRKHGSDLESENPTKFIKSQEKDESLQLAQEQSSSKETDIENCDQNKNGVSIKAVCSNFTTAPEVDDDCDIAIF